MATVGSFFTLHRSEVHAQPEADAQEAKVKQINRRNRRGQQIRRGRVQFKELGAPVDNTEIAKMTSTKIGKVQRMVQNMGTQHHEASKKKGDGDRAMEKQDGDPKDGELLDGDKQDEDLGEEDEAQQTGAPSPHGLFGYELPRCTGAHKGTDGFKMLREFVRESETRVQQVKSMVPGTCYGLDYKVSMLDYLMPARADYPPSVDKRALSARASISKEEAREELKSQSAPSSARALHIHTDVQDLDDTSEFEIRPPSGQKPKAPRPPVLMTHERREVERKARNCPGRPVQPQAYHRQVYVSPVQSEMRPRQLPIRLPSLADWIEKSEPAMGGRSERGENSHIRDMINELLGMDKDKVLKLPQEDASGLRRGRMDFKRKIEKQLDVIWGQGAAGDEAAQRGANRAALRKLIATGGPAEEGKMEPERAAGAPDAQGAPGSEEMPGGGQDGSLRRKREYTEAEEADAYAKFVALLRETDPNISPVARLRSTLQSYQESRLKHRGHLQSALYSMDADRLNSLKRRARFLQPTSDGPLADAKTACSLMRLEAERHMLGQHTEEHMKKRYLWYRDLWHHVRGDKRDLPRVAHFIFDFVKQVLEYGEEFQKDMYYAMLEQIENYEFTPVIASLTVNMTVSSPGIDGVGPQDIVEWFRATRGEVPPSVMELTGKQEHPAKLNTELGDGQELGVGAEAKGSKNSLTFLTAVT